MMKKQFMIYDLGYIHSLELWLILVIIFLVDLVL